MTTHENPSTLEVLEWVASGQLDRLVASIPDQMDVRQARAMFENELLQVGPVVNPFDERWHLECIDPDEVDQARKEGYEKGLHDGRKEVREQVLGILEDLKVERPAA